MGSQLQHGIGRRQQLGPLVTEEYGKKMGFRKLDGRAVGFAENKHIFGDVCEASVTEGSDAQHL